MPTLSPLGLLDRFLHGPAQPALPAQPAQPLQGVTLLAVEDSRFSADALRLLCQRSGARLRRVATLDAAYAHLRVYRPDVMLIDMGLPDGRGDTLIRDLAKLRPQGPIILGISGDPATRADAIAAGAQGFIDKPFPNLAAFQDAILCHLPDRANRAVATTANVPITPDPLAWQDDLEHAAGLVKSNPTILQRRYLAGFIAGIARSADDPALAAAANDMMDSNGLDRLCQLLAARINTCTNPFGGSLS